uniref:Uncharacterized protein n=1 Tax=Aegilops tauschii TaxID=37682 RepID=M8B799_AEGTA
MRGDVYLGRQLAAAAAAGARTRTPEEDAERRRRRKEKRRALAKKMPSGVACCYGCGAPLHTGEEGSPGHVEPATYDLKKRHNQLKTVLCRRCKLLSHGRVPPFFSEALAVVSLDIRLTRKSSKSSPPTEAMNHHCGRVGYKGSRLPMCP